MGWSRSRRARPRRVPRISAAAPAGMAKPLFDRFAQRQPGNGVSRSRLERGAECGSRAQSPQVACYVRRLGQIDEAVGEMQAVTDADVRGTESGTQQILPIGQARLQDLHR